MSPIEGDRERGERRKSNVGALAQALLYQFDAALNENPTTAETALLDKARQSTFFLSIVARAVNKTSSELTALLREDHVGKEPSAIVLLRRILISLYSMQGHIDDVLKHLLALPKGTHQKLLAQTAGTLEEAFYNKADTYVKNAKAAMDKAGYSYKEVLKLPQFQEGRQGGPAGRSSPGK